MMAAWRVRTPRYLLIDKASQTCAAFDPVEPAKVLATAEAEGVTVEQLVSELV